MADAGLARTFRQRKGQPASTISRWRDVMMGNLAERA